MPAPGELDGGRDAPERDARLPLKERGGRQGGRNGRGPCLCVQGSSRVSSLESSVCRDAVAPSTNAAARALGSPCGNGS